MAEEQKLGLPDNWKRKLNNGEKYVPVVSNNSSWRQSSSYAVILGFFMVVIFTGASAFLGVKIAQVPEASMTVALVAVALAKILKRNNSLLENVIIQSMASVSTGVAAGALFVLPAIYILELEISNVMMMFLQMFLAVGLGAFIGLLLMILLKRYYVVEQHGEYEFPEATATTEILVSGVSSGAESRAIWISLLVGYLVDFGNNYFGFWKSIFQTSYMPVLKGVAEKGKLLFNYDTSLAILGMGYLVGIRFALYMCVACMVGYYILVPCFAFGYSDLLPFIPDYLWMKISGGQAISHEAAMASASADDIFIVFVRPIGIGVFFMAGVIGIIKQFRKIVDSVKTSFKQTKLSSSETSEEHLRDLKMNLVLILLGITMLVFFGYIFGLVGLNVLIAVVVFFIAAALLIVFVPAAIMATVTMGNAPVSGMTIVTLVLACIALLALGFKGKDGMLVAALFGTFMCTALAFSSSFVTDLKIGYWLGATPAKQQALKLASTFVSVAVVIFAMHIINQEYGFVKSDAHQNPMPAPQANAMASIIKTFLGGGQAPWYLYGFGMAMAIILNWMGISALAVALGLYIPIEYNIPLLGGAIIAMIVSKQRKDDGDEKEKLAKERYDRGTLIGTGFVAGGSIAGITAGILKYILKYYGFDLPTWFFVHFLGYPALVNDNGEMVTYSLATNYDWSNWISLLIIVFSIWFFYWYTSKKTKTQKA
ncbi:MAG: OPT/YSL family transporter [Patescibacteria group bacterium]|jgi:putative OPT family oligopeptide transporter